MNASGSGARSRARRRDRHLARHHVLSGSPSPLAPDCSPTRPRGGQVGEPEHRPVAQVGPVLGSWRHGPALAPGSRRGGGTAEGAAHPGRRSTHVDLVGFESSHQGVLSARGKQNAHARYNGGLVPASPLSPSSQRAGRPTRRRIRGTRVSAPSNSPGSSTPPISREPYLPPCTITSQTQSYLTHTCMLHTPTPPRSGPPSRGRWRWIPTLPPAAGQGPHSGPFFIWRSGQQCDGSHSS